MDPRYPEQAITRINELMAQYNQILSIMKTSSTSALLAEQERQGSLVVQEICLVAPRLHEAMMQVSRTRRFTLSHTPVEPTISADMLKAPSLETIEKYIEQAKEDYEERPKKKTSKKKKED